MTEATTYIAPPYPMRVMVEEPPNPKRVYVIAIALGSTRPMGYILSDGTYELAHDVRVEMWINEEWRESDET